MLPLASSINSQLQYRGDMRARSKRRSKVSVGAVGFVDTTLSGLLNVSHPVGASLATPTTIQEETSGSVEQIGSKVGRTIAALGAYAFVANRLKRGFGGLK
jgi:hypothetical protein